MVPPVAVHVTEVLVAPVTVAVNCAVAPSATEAGFGDTVTTIAGAELTMTVTVLVTAPAELVAVKV